MGEDGWDGLVSASVNPVGTISSSATTSLARTLTIAGHAHTTTYTWTPSASAPTRQASKIERIGVRFTGAPDDTLETRVHVFVDFEDGSTREEEITSRVVPRDPTSKATAPPREPTRTDALEERLAAQARALEVLWDFLEERGLFADAVALCDDEGVSTGTHA